MKLVFIYGTPGGGKVIMAQALPARRNLTSAIAGRGTLEIDNSALTADAVVRRIAAHFSLPTGGEPRGGVRS